MNDKCVKILWMALLLPGFFLNSCSNRSQEYKRDLRELEIKFKPVARSAVFSSDTLSIWGGSLVKDKDGIYHLFYSRWPKKLGWEWVTHSEIAHATSSSAFGPFKFQDVALPPRGKEYWDGMTTHNPTIHLINGKYYLYYMGCTGDREVVSAPGKPRLNWQHRNQQRIGVAVAESPNGPWKRFDQPVLDISKGDKDAPDALMTSNPSICQMKNGKILMVYKAVGLKHPLPQGGPVVHMVAIADNPLGPFYKEENPVFTFEGERFPAEDPYIWFQEGRYQAIVKRIEKREGRRHFSLMHYNSPDGIDWQPGKYVNISDRTITWEDGKIQQFDHLERPQLYIEDGKPLALLCAADTLDKEGIRHSFNLQIPVKIIAHEP